MYKGIYILYIYILYIHIRLLMLTPGMAALRNLVFLGLFRCWWCWYFIYVHGNFCMVWGGGGGANSVQSSAFFDSPSCISYSNIQHDLASTLWREERFNTLVMLCCCTSYGNFQHSRDVTLLHFLYIVINFQHAISSWHNDYCVRSWKTPAAITGVTFFMYELFYMIRHRYCSQNLYICNYIYI